MRFESVVILAVLLLIGESLANSCKTCRGQDCARDNVFELDCTKYIPALPFESQLIAYESGVNSEYGCLDLEYYVGDSVEQIQQCVLSDELGSFCVMLENVLKIASCNIEPTSVLRNERSVGDSNLQANSNLQEEDLGSGDTDEPPPTTTPSPDSAVTHLISFACLVAVAATLLL